MATIDAFHADPFTMISLTDAVERNPFRPTGIGSLNLFDDKPIRTTALAVEQRQGQLVLIQTTPRGVPAVGAGGEFHLRQHTRPAAVCAADIRHAA